MAKWENQRIARGKQRWLSPSMPPGGPIFQSVIPRDVIFFFSLMGSSICYCQRLAFEICCNWRCRFPCGAEESCYRGAWKRGTRGNKTQGAASQVSAAIVTITITQRSAEQAQHSTTLASVPRPKSVSLEPLIVASTMGWMAARHAGRPGRSSLRLDRAIL